jgi:hypothetical protein
MALAAGWALVRRDSERRAVATLGGVALVLGTLQVALFAAIGWPGLEETLQDLFTGHFKQPDVAAPLARLIPYIVHHRYELAAAVLPTPLVPIGVLLGLTPLLLVERWWARLWIPAGLITFLTVLVHPLHSQVSRLMAPLWLSVALGGALGLAVIGPWLHALVANATGSPKDG